MFHKTRKGRQRELDNGSNSHFNRRKRQETAGNVAEYEMLMKNVRYKYNKKKNKGEKRRGRKAAEQSRSWSGLKNIYMVKRNNNKKKPYI